MDFAHPVEAVIGGTRGRLLAVLAETTAPLSLRRLARLADVSPAQASRVLPGLVELGLVVRAEVPPSSTFILDRDNVAAQTVIELAGMRRTVLRRIGSTAETIDPQPTSVIVFGSLARGDADSASDVDIVVVRPEGVETTDEQWSDSVEAWRQGVASISGSDVELVDASELEAGRKLRGRSELWRNIKREGVVVFGATIDELQEGVLA